MADLIREAEQPRVASWPGIDQEPTGLLQAEPLQAAALVPTGRILPVLSDPAPLLAIVEREPNSPTLEIVVDVRLEVDGVIEMAEAEVEQFAPMPTIDTKTIAATLLLRQGRSRLPRYAFRREDRWKARLPDVVHRTRKRGT